MKTDTRRFDILYGEDGPSIDYHFCRQWDESGGCYGTNPDHGYTLEEAVEECATWYEEIAKEYRNKTHPDIVYFLENKGMPEDSDD